MSEKQTTGWLPMSSAPKDGTVVLLCELNYSTGEGYVMPGCWMRACGDPQMDNFWAVAPTSHVPAHLIDKHQNREGMAVGWRSIALTPLCWKPMPEAETVQSLKRRQARQWKREAERRAALAKTTGDPQ